MAIKYELVQPGMLLWQKRRQRMGNTTMSRDAWFPVQIIEVQERGCLVCWNGNAPRMMYRRDVQKLYRKKPEKAHD